MSSTHATGFMVLHSNQLEGLRELMVQFIRNHPLPPLAPEVLLVQSNGMKHWVELALAKELGICAATQIELPSSKLWQIYRAVLGADQVPAHMPLDKSPLVWRIMRRLPELLKQEKFQPLANYLGDHALYDRRAYQLAAQLADVLDGYQNYRADWLEDWANGADQLRTPAGQSTTALPDAQSWQPALWRDLVADLSADVQHSFSSRADVHKAFMAKMNTLAEGERPAGVPHRIMVFGVTSLPTQTVQALAALGRVCQVLMLVQNPCQHYWGHVVESRVPLLKLTQLSHQRQAHKAGLPVPNEDGFLSEADQYTLHTDTQPLLAAWGKHGRDYLHLLDGFDDVNQYKAQFNRVDVFVDPVQTALDEGRTPSTLAHLQSSLLHLEPLPPQPREIAADDHSITFVKTHSAQREVEVLHDQLLAWLDADANLKPSDIMVMVPDMANFAPHIHAVFGRFAQNEVRHIPYSVADTTPRTEPLVQALDRLLQLPQLRVTRVEWQSLFEVAAVRKRFGLEEHDVAQLDDWLSKAGVRWGLNAQHRKPWGIDPDMADANQNSWMFGIERLLLGYAVGENKGADHTALPTPWANTLPQAGLGGLDAHTVDGLLQWLRHTHIALLKLRQDHSPAEWVAVLQQLMDMFFKPTDEADERLIERIMAPLETWLAECQLARLETPLPLVVVREHWMAQLQQPAMQRRFFGGGVQFATLMPMRSIPFKCVCLLGMNDGDYPRNQTPRDFDLMSDAAHSGDQHTHSHWRAGDRSRREDDRYLFLEALLSAREKLFVSWQGLRTTDHEVKPPSVLIAQLMDYLNATWVRHGQLAFEAKLQPLQAFSAKYFRQDSDVQTYADDWQKAQGTAPVEESRHDEEHHGIKVTELTLQHLSRLLKQPVDVYVRDRLRLHLDTPEEASAEDEPFALNNLEKFLLTQSIVQAPDPEQAVQVLRLSGELALSGFGQAQQDLLLQQRNELLERFNDITQDWSLDLAVQSARFALNDCTLAAEWANGQHVWKTKPDQSAWLQIEMRAGAVMEGKEKNKHPRTETLTTLWLNHLVACASGTPTTSVQIGLNGVVQFGALPQAKALTLLQDMMALYQEAWHRPLPIARKTACAYLAAQHFETDITPTAALQVAQQVFEGQRHKAGEFETSSTLQRVFKNFADLQDELPSLAERIYGTMVAHVTTNEADA